MQPVMRDRLGSILMLAFIAALWVQRDYVSPLGGMFPDTVMGIMALFVVVTLILSFTPYRALKDDGKAQAAAVPPHAAARVAIVVIILALWVGLFRYLGFAFTGVVGFASIAWYLSGAWTDWKEAGRAVVLGAIVAFVIYMVFDYFLLVPLPAGDLFLG